MTIEPLLAVVVASVGIVATAPATVTPTRVDDPTVPVASDPVPVAAAGAPVGGCAPVDQSQPTSEVGIAAFSQPDLAQSFTPAASTICGASVTVFSAGALGVAEVKIELYDDLPNAGGTQLASGTVDGVPSGAKAIVDFGEVVSVTPGETYHLVFTGGGPDVSLGGTVFDSYAGGQVFAGAGFQPFPQFDYAFETYGESPLCAAPDQGQFSSLTDIATFAQVDLAQSFRPERTSVCGASVVLWDNGVAVPFDVTIELWDDLPNQGGAQLAVGIDTNVVAGGAAIVDFGGPVPVAPNDTYYLVFRSSLDAVAVGGTPFNSYPGGQFFANPGFEPLPSLDAHFTTYGEDVAPPCPTDLDGNGATGFADLLELLTEYGPCPGCASDFDGDGTVGFGDLLLLLTEYGPCP